MNDFIKKLKEDPLVYYIYQTDLSIYGIEDKPLYTVIVDDNSDYISSDLHSDIVFYSMSIWFKMMEENTLITWICSCLDRKYIVKEHVKLMIPFDALKLRRNTLIQLRYSDYQHYPELEDCLSEMTSDIITLNLVNQILENHKIVNFKSPLKEYNSLLKCKDYYSTLTKYKEIINKELEYLHKSTDDLYKQDLIKKHTETNDF